MQRQCAWFGCSAVAAATYTFDSNTCTVWLDTPFEGGARAGDLCNRHARSLTPPRGWQLDDRRPHLEVSSTASTGARVREHLDSAAETELRTMLDAHSPLLARAFRSSGAE